MRDSTLIQREVYAAESYLAQEMANAATPFIRAMILPHTFSIAEDRPKRLTWLRGVWLHRKRGMILTSDGQSVLWAAVEPPVPGAHSDRLVFNLHFLELSADRRLG